MKNYQILMYFLTPADKKLAKDRDRSEKKIIKITAERELKKETPAREPSRDASRDQGREASTRERSVKEIRPKERETKERETKERDDVEGLKKRDKEKDRRREKRPTSPLPEFEGDLSSVSNSSNGSIHPAADIVIVEDQRGEIIKIYYSSYDFNYPFSLQKTNGVKLMPQPQRLVSQWCNEKDNCWVNVMKPLHQ